ncbi:MULTISPECIES: 4Fe-4S binding protein [Azotobacter]|uniref:4Fe-4S binding protein n=1 Tax=Azotobacter TaxID=352 RepID=UPI0006806C97|nr:4Fe-4S binding protein [Azotobacter vinelandii]
MVLTITEECIYCAACFSECPSGAIFAGDFTYIINFQSCTECVDKYSEPQCISVCPADAIVSSGIP